MKTIGIIAALEEEINSIKNRMEIKVKKIVINTEFCIGSLSGKSIVAVKCGIGKVNAAVCAQVLIDLFAVDYIINTGVAGGIHKEMSVGDLVISTDVIHHDFDCSVFGTARGEIPFMDKSTFAADETLVTLAKKAAEELGINNGRNIFAARVASGDIFVNSKEKKKEIWNTVGGYCAEMEGAAIAQACYLNKVPFIIIRTISDNADDKGNTDFAKFALESAEISSRLTEKIIEYV